MNSMISKELRLLLQWTKSLITKLWDRANSPTTPDSSLFEKIWLPLLIILLIVCTIVDIVVYRKRWRPDWVRKSLKHYDKQQNAPSTEERPAVRNTPARPAQTASVTDQRPSVYARPSTLQQSAMPEPESINRPFMPERNPFCADDEEDFRFDDVPEEWAQPIAQTRNSIRIQPDMTPDRTMTYHR